MARPLEECCALVCYPSPYVLATVLRVPFETIIYDAAQRFGESPSVYGERAEQIDLQLAALADARSCDSLALVGERVSAGFGCHRMVQGLDRNYAVAPASSETSLLGSPKAKEDPPIIGYLGALWGVLDWDLVISTALLMPQCLFAMVGPQRAPVPSPLPGNIRLCGWVPATDAPKMIRSFSVGMIPYRLNRRTEAVLPSKLVEYLACGRRVVSTPLPDVAAFAQDAGPQTVRVAEGAADFADALRDLIVLGPLSTDETRAIWDEYNWDHLVGEFVDYVERERSASCIMVRGSLRL